MEIGLFVTILLLGILLGWLFGWFLAKLYYQKSQLENQDTSQTFIRRDIHDLLLSDLERERTLSQQKEMRLHGVYQDLAAAEEQARNLEQKLAEQKSSLENYHLQMQSQFENLANKLLEEKSERFTRQNGKQLSEILSPLKEKIEGFEKKVTESYQQESRERASLKGEIKTLLDLNQRISEEARNLAKALKGDTKKQGNWGELILERVLERSGLVKGQEYDLQVADTNAEGRRIQPDVVVHLPDQKHLVIDAKVSLSAYEKLVNAESPEEKNEHLKLHLQSLRNHIQRLAEKNYTEASHLHCPDFVLMFLPIESSFSLALQADNDLFNFAWEKKIVIVSPTTLLATLRTVASLWKQEKQTKNALEIAKQAGGLYDKFAGFVEDMQRIESGIQQAEKAYNDAMNKLQSGHGNLLRRAEKIRKLGIKTSKTLPPELTELTE